MKFSGVERSGGEGQDEEEKGREGERKGVGRGAKVKKKETR